MNCSIAIGIRWQTLKISERNLHKSQQWTGVFRVHQHHHLLQLEEVRRTTLLMFRLKIANVQIKESVKDHVFPVPKFLCLVDLPYPHKEKTKQKLLVH